MSSYSMNVTCGSFAPGKKKRQLDFKGIYNRSILQVYDYLLSSYDAIISSEPLPLISAIHRWRDSNHDDSFQNIINPKYH